MKVFKLIVAAKLLLVALVFSCFTGCVTNPETGRHQLMLVPESQMTQLGLSSFNQMKKEVPISKDAKANDLLQRVGKRIASVVNLPGAQWEFVVFDSKEANAFCLRAERSVFTPASCPSQRMTRGWRRSSAMKSRTPRCNTVGSA